MADPTPPQYVCVPVEPTEEWCRSVWDAYGRLGPVRGNDVVFLRAVVKAMLAASPNTHVAVERRLLERWEELLAGSNPLGWSDDIGHRIRWQSCATDLLDELRALLPK